MFYKSDYIFLGKLLLFHCIFTNCHWYAYINGTLRTKCSHYCVSVFLSLFSICSLVPKHRSAPLSGGIMEKKIIYLKTLQFVLTLIIIWQLLSLRQFCGTFANPKAFIHDISLGHCKSFSLIAKDSKTGEFNSMFNKLFTQFFMSSPTAEQRHQFMDELAAKLPPAGRQCIPITISPFYCVFDWIFKWTGILNRNPLSNDTLFHFSRLIFFALLSLVPMCIVIMEMLRSVEEYEVESLDILRVFAFAIGWVYSVAISFNLLFFWSHFWTCFNFQADRTIVPFDTLMLSIVMVCLYVFELFYKIREIATYDIDE